MGSEINTSIGVYMIVDGEKTEMIDKSVNTCSNEECDNHKSNKDFGDQKFCSKCASPIVVKTYEDEYKTDADGFFSNLAYEREDIDEDALCWTDPMGGGGGVFISNHYSPFDKKRVNSNDELLSKYGEVTDLTEVNLEEEIKWFNEEYKNIIDIFKKEFGEDSVRIGWGIIEWYS